MRQYAWDNVAIEVDSLDIIIRGRAELFLMLNLLLICEHDTHIPACKALSETNPTYILILKIYKST